MVDLKSDKLINHAASHHFHTHRSIRRKAGVVGIKAKANLAEHRHDGDSRIHVTRGGKLKGTKDVDLLVVLDDERGLGAAMSIEFGRDEETTNPRGPSNPTNVLHDAAGIKGRGKGRIKRRVREDRRNKGRRK
jgi:hypothetical protein